LTRRREVAITFVPGTLSLGGATLEVDCFTYDAASGWQPASATFDFQIVGPSG